MREYSIGTKDYGFTIFNGITLFKHKGHNGHEGKTKEIKTLFPLCVLPGTARDLLSKSGRCGVLRVKAFPRQKRERQDYLCKSTFSTYNHAHVKQQ